MEQKTSQELELADQLLKDAKLLLEEESLRSSVNRAYYAAYHGVRALLASTGMNPKTHKGVLNQFGDAFIKTKKMDITLSDTLRKCFDARHEADYDIYATFNEEEVETILNEVETLLEEIRQYLS
jgi:uncharacterized protein (UPF0332 family)